MKCLHPYLDKKTGNQYNCGKCVHCRANKGSQWKLRCIYELDDWNSAIFLTLTYSDQWLHDSGQVSGNCTLKKKDAVDFIKRLRSSLKYDFPDRDFNYFLCGEYSPKKPSRNVSVMCPMGERPHYHAIIFGLNRYSDYDRKLIIDSWCPPNAQRCEPWQFDRARGKKDGIQEVTFETIGYVTDYASKKLYGDYAKAEYDDRGREKPFHINGQGLGLNFALKNAERLKVSNFSYINGQKIGLPKYLRDKLESGITIKKESVQEKMKRIKAENQYLSELFEKQTGLSPSNLELYTRRFEQWYDEHRFEYSNQIFAQFQARAKMYGKEI